jgi:hypothetical protein
MPKIRHPFHLRVTLPATVVLVILLGVCLSFYTHDPHWLNRSGALIAATAAGAILLQIKAELQLELEKERLATPSARNLAPGPTTPLGRKEIQLTTHRIEFQIAQLSRSRLVVAAFVVASAMLGELLHGFGDLLMCYGFSVCASHVPAGEGSEHPPAHIPIPAGHSRLPDPESLTPRGRHGIGPDKRAPPAQP